MEEAPPFEISNSFLFSIHQPFNTFSVHQKSQSSQIETPTGSGNGDNFNSNNNNNYDEVRGHFRPTDIIEVISSTVSSYMMSSIKNHNNQNNWTIANTSTMVESPSLSSLSSFPGKSVIIPLYTLIFFLSFGGNSLVILTLVRNRRMRTVTNVFLFNLAVSDLLLGVLCLPATLVGQILKNFIFGSVMCKVIPYAQAVAVSVSIWTLVSISLERYFAICRPLKSRKWQTRSHAYKMIVGVWIVTLIGNTPIAFTSQLQPIRDTGRYKCREIWPDLETEKIFNLLLDFVLLLIPLCIMAIAYSLIVSKLWKGLQNEIRHTRTTFCTPHQQQSGMLQPPENSIELNSAHSHRSLQHVYKPERSSAGSVASNAPNEILTLKGGRGVVVRWKKKESAIEMNELSVNSVNHNHSTHINGISRINGQAGVRTQVLNGAASSSNNNINSKNFMIHRPPILQKQNRTIRSNYTGKSIESKRKVIKMLFVLIGEFFISWTPLYVMNTWYLFNPDSLYNIIGTIGISLIHLLAYSSSCLNPVIYAFMNRKFRQAFIKVFQCTGNGNGKGKRRKYVGPPTNRGNSDASGNDSIIYGVQGSTMLNNKSGLRGSLQNNLEIEDQGEPLSPQNHSHNNHSEPGMNNIFLTQHQIPSCSSSSIGAISAAALNSNSRSNNQLTTTIIGPNDDQQQHQQQQENMSIGLENMNVVNYGLSLSERDDGHVEVVHDSDENFQRNLVAFDDQNQDNNDDNFDEEERDPDYVYRVYWKKSEKKKPVYA